MNRWLPGLLVVIAAVALPPLSRPQEHKASVIPQAGTKVIALDTAGRRISGAAIRFEGGAIQVTAPGFLPWSGRPGPRGKGVLQVVLLRPASIRGRVTSRGAGLSGFTLRLKREEGLSDAELAKISTKNGFYEIESLTPGIQTLMVEAQGFVPREQSEPVREGEVRWLDLDLRPAARLVATLLDEKGNPLVGVKARVRIDADDGRFFEDGERKRLSALLAVSDEKGRLILGPLGQELRHRVVFQLEGRPLRSIVLTPSTPSVTREIKMSAGGALKLTLKDRDGHPVPGAAARLDSDDAPDVDLLPETWTSGTDGILTLGPLPSGTYALRLQAEGFRPRTLRGCTVMEKATTDQGEIRLDPGMEVSGIVRDDGGSPVVGAAIRARFYESGRLLAASGKSDRAGRFHLRGLPAGRVAIQVEAKGYIPEKMDEVDVGTANLELELTRTGFISGQVVANETGMPVSAFNLNLRPEQNDGSRGRMPKDTQTTFEDKDGRFVVEGLPPGKYHVSVKARGYKPAAMEGVDARSAGSEPLEVRLDTGLRIDGVVLDADNRAPVSGAIVRATGLLPEETDLKGRFQIEGLDGKTRVQVEHPRYLTEVVAEVDPERTSDLEILLRRGGAVEGTVFGEYGEPVPGAEVRALLAEGERKVITLPGGHYRLEGLPPGPQVLTKVEVPGTYKGYESAVVRVEPGAVTSHDFGTGTRLHGSITHGGVPAADAQLTLAQVVSELPEGTRLLGSRAVRSGEDGSYEARGLHAGTYGLIVIWEARKVGKLIVIPEGEATWQMDIDIPDLWLSGTVVDKGTRLPLRATVVAIPIRQGQPPGGYSSVMNDGEGTVEFSSSPQSSVETDAQGNFRLPLMEPGAYHMFANARGYRLEESLEVEVKESRSDLSLEMAPAMGLVVKAVDATTGRFLEPRCASVISNSDRSTKCGEGAARFTSLRPGDLVVTVEVADYALGYQKLDLTADQQEVTIPLTPGGRLRLLLPVGIGNDELSLLHANLHIEDGAGSELTAMFPSLRVWLGVGGGTSDAEGAVVIPHAPLGRLKISLGGGGTGVKPTKAEVIVEERSETVADLR